MILALFKIFTLALPRTEWYCCSLNFCPSVCLMIWTLYRHTKVTLGTIFCTFCRTFNFPYPVFGDRIAPQAIIFDGVVKYLIQWLTLPWTWTLTTLAEIRLFLQVFWNREFVAIFWLKAISTMLTFYLIQYVAFVVHVLYYNWSYHAYHGPETRQSWLGCDYCPTFSGVGKNTLTIFAHCERIDEQAHPTHPPPDADVYQTTRKKAS